MIFLNQDRSRQPCNHLLPTPNYRVLFKHVHLCYNLFALTWFVSANDKTRSMRAMIFHQRGVVSDVTENTPIQASCVSPRIPSVMLASDDRVAITPKLIEWSTRQYMTLILSAIVFIAYIIVMWARSKDPRVRTYDYWHVLVSSRSVDVL